MIDYNDLFTYKDGCIYWKINGPMKKIGKRAGGFTTNGYRTVGVSGVKLYEHRIIWQMFYGPIDDGVTIDHKNHNTIDNRIDNLRLATQSEQNYNTKLRVNNTSGVRGVSFDKRRDKWVAYIHVDSKRIHLGYFDCFNDAEVVVNTARAKLHKDFKYNLTE
jgi:hypothetical protein